MTFTSKHPTAVVIGGGPAGLMAAERLASRGAVVRLFDQMPSLGRKFLMAGRGGLNLTHSEEFTRFLSRYGDGAPSLEAALKAFPPESLVAWCERLGQPTFVGSSGRIFPQTLKASPLLRAWLRRLADLKVQIGTRHRWEGWTDAGELSFYDASGIQHTEAPDATILALGGASWPRLGSDGAWTGVLRKKGVDVLPLRPSNSGFITDWTPYFLERFEGQPLKPVILSLGERQIQGELVITRQGIEGSALYALSGELRKAIDQAGQAVLHLDVRPAYTLDELAKRLQVPRGSQSLSTYLRKSAGLSPLAIALLREVSQSTPLPGDALSLAKLIKNIPLKLTGIAGIDRAISSAGGISLGEIDKNYMLKKLPTVFAVGEMLDWEAPTGGYLLQAAFSTGMAAAHGVERYWQTLGKYLP